MRPRRDRRRTRARAVVFFLSTSRGIRMYQRRVAGSGAGSPRVSSFPTLRENTTVGGSAAPTASSPHTRAHGRRPRRHSRSARVERASVRARPPAHSPAPLGLPARVRASIDGGALRRRAPGHVGRAGGDVARRGVEPAPVPARSERARRARRHRRARRRDGRVGHRGSGQEALHADEQRTATFSRDSRRGRTG